MGSSYGTGCCAGAGGAPGFEVGLRFDAQVGGHAEVTEAADLGAEDGVSSGCGGSEVDVDGLSGDCVLLEAEGGDGEAVHDILGAEPEVDFTASGEDELGGDEVVGCAGIGGIEAEGIAFAGGDELGAGASEGGVGARISKVPGELDAHGFDLERAGFGTGVAGGGPESLGFEGEAGEEEGECGDGEGLEESGGAGLCGLLTQHEAGEEEEMREREEGEGDEEIEQQVAIESGAVSCGIDRHGPEGGWHVSRRGIR